MIDAFFGRIRAGCGRRLGRHKDQSRRRPSRLRLEALENRLALASLTVLTVDDGPGVVTPNGPGAYTASTLRAAVDFANANADQDVITFAAALANGTILLNANDTVNPLTLGPTAFVITTAMTIDGGNLNLTLSGQTLRRLFGVLPTGTLTLKGLSLTNGMAQGGAGGNAGVPIQGAAGAAGAGAGGGGAGLGGAIYGYGGVLNIIDSTLSYNVAQGGAGGNTLPLANESWGSGGGGSAFFDGGSATAVTTLAGSGGGGVNGPGGRAIDRAGGNGGANQVNQQAGADVTAKLGGGGGGGNATARDWFTFSGVNHSGAPGTSISSAGFGGGGGGGANGDGFWGDGEGALGGFGAGGGGGGIGRGGNGGFGGGGGGAGHQAGSSHPISGTPGTSLFGGGNGGLSQFSANQTQRFGGAGGGGLGAGGAIFLYYTELIMSGSTVTQNSALGGAGGSALSFTGQGGNAGSGLGAIFGLNAILTINTSTIDNNTNSTASSGQVEEFFSGGARAPGGITVRAGQPARLVDSDDDSYRVRLLGPGTAVVTIRDSDGDGKGPIAGIVLDGTTSESQLLVEVLPRSTGNRHVNIASISGERIGRITAAQSSLIHSGMRIKGRIDSLTIQNVFAAVTADAIGSATVLGNVANSVWSILGSSSGRLGTLAVNGTFSRSLVSASRIGSVKLNAVARAPAVVEARTSIASVSVARPAFSAAAMTSASLPRTLGQFIVRVGPA